jgi:putative spermidine/putrescine transport system permease protein
MTAATGPAPRPRPVGRRIASFFYRHPRLQLGGLLIAPAAWLIVLYLGSLILMLVTSFWSYSASTNVIDRSLTLENYVEIAQSQAVVTVILRTVLMAALVTVGCAVIAFPIAYYMARVASPRVRRLLVVAVIVPLWASYVAKIYAWRLIFSEQGVLNWAIEPIGLRGPGTNEVALFFVFVYLWLPYMILPVYAGLERIPGSLLEASADLGGRPRHTFARVTLPLAFPAVVAGSIFTFSLTLGDYIAPTLITKTIFLGNIIQLKLGQAGDIPYAAAMAMIPIVIMLGYLLLARRLGAFEAV